MSVQFRPPQALTAAVLLVLSAPGAAQITTASTLGAAGHMTAGREGSLYWVEYEDGKIGYRTSGGTIGEIPLLLSFSHPSGIAAGPDGYIWFTESFTSNIGRYNPRALANPVTEFGTTTFGAAPYGICAGPDGRMWFAESFVGMIGAITTDGTITEYPTSNGVNPGQITLGADGNLYFTEPAANRIGRISAKGAATDYPIPTDAAGPNGIALGPDGNIWFCETSVNKIGRLSIGLLSYSVTEFPLPNAGSQPTDIALGPDGALWFTEASGNRLGRITTSGVITEIPLSGGLESFGVAAGLDGGLWFTDPNVKKLARHSVAADVNRDGVTDIADVFYLVNYLFANGPVPK